MVWSVASQPEKYTGSTDQINVIALEISNFQAIQKELFSVDNKSLGLSLSTIVLYQLNWIGTGLGIVGLIGSYLYANYIDSRPVLSKQFQDQLAKLYKLYLACVENNTLAITKDPAFLKLLETIAPFIVDSKKNLLSWNMQTVDPADLSPTFVEILSREPHRIQFVIVGQKPTSYFNSAAKLLFNAYTTPATSENIVENTLVTQVQQYIKETRLIAQASKFINPASCFRFFKEAYAEANQIAYGYQPVPVESKPSNSNSK